MAMTILLTGLLSAGVLADRAAGPSITFYVSPSGNDQWSGRRATPTADRTDGPLATLTAARDAVRRIKQAGPLPAGGVTVEIGPGMYRLAQPLQLEAGDSGTAEAPIVYRAAQRGTAVLSGGVVLGRWQPVSEPGVRKRLDPQARSKVLWIEVDRSLLEELPGFANGGCGFESTKKREYPLALYQAEQRLPVARWPNKEYATMGECLGNSVIAGHVGRKFIDGIFRFDNPRLMRWLEEPDLWFNGLWFHPWADEKIHLESIDPEQKTIALANGHAFGFKKGQEFYAFNAVSEIDRPGEWAVDRSTRRIYLWPPVDPKTEPVVLAVGETLVRAKDLSWVTFDGLVFEACRQTALDLTRPTSFTLAASTVRHTGSWAVNLNGGRQGTVVGCDLYDLGEGGVAAVGGDRNKLIPGRHLIENNHIHHIGRVVACYRPGASVRGVGNTIRHNLIYQTDHQAIFFDGNDHLIEYNIVHDVCLHTSDAGPLYACARDWTKRGTVIRHNLFHAAGEGVDGCGCRGIYLDDFTSGTTVASNIVSLADCGINLGGGKDNLVVDNLLLNCRVPVALHSRGIDSFARVNAARGKESPYYKKLLREVYQSDLWRKRYPKMLDALAMDPIEAHNAHSNTIRHNLSAGSGEVRIANAKRVMKTCVIENNPTVEEDPGFVDLKELDFRLRPDAPIREELAGFQAPDFARMGLYDDPRRASPAVKFGPEVTPMLPIMSLEDRQQTEIATLFPVGREPGAEAMIESAAAGARSARTSRARFTLEGDCLSVVIRSAVDPKRELALGKVWGTDDGVEMALLAAHGSGRQETAKPFVLRGYAGGGFESVTVGGVQADEAERLAKAAEYTARVPAPGLWEACWRIPLAALRIDVRENHLPLLAQVAVYRSADKTWTTWSPRRAGPTWNVQGAHALWLEPLGDLAFLPGTKASVSRVAVRWGRDQISMQAGMGANNPVWAPGGSRIEAPFGTVPADRWQSYRFEFTPESDGQVIIELMGTQGTPTAWTYYDDFRVEGATLVNGDFELLDENGRPQGWRVFAAEGIPELFVENSRLAGSGKRMVMASHDYRTTQSIAVRGGQKVTVQFKARGALGTGQP